MERNRSQLNYDTYSPDGTDDVTVVVVVKTVSRLFDVEAFWSTD